MVSINLQRKNDLQDNKPHINIQTIADIQTFPGKGRGIVATTDIPAGVVVEVCPVIVVPHPEVEHLFKTHAGDYSFEWDEFEGDPAKKNAALLLGWSSLLNHHDQPNMDWSWDIEAQTVSFFTIRDIKSGEELCFDYGGALWFPKV